MLAVLVWPALNAESRALQERSREPTSPNRPTSGAARGVSQVSAPTLTPISQRRPTRLASARVGGRLELAAGLGLASFVGGALGAAGCGDGNGAPSWAS